MKTKYTRLVKKGNTTKVHRLVHVVPLGLAVTLLFGAGSAHALTTVDPAGGCAQTLSTPGEYILTGDLACSGAVSGVNITASNVVFHLAGHTISNTTCDPSVNFGGIFVTGGISGVKIDGGTVSGFNDGIFLNPTSAGRVSGMTVTNACIFGIVVSGKNNRLDKNVVTKSGLDGVVLDKASGTVITSNDISGNVRLGVDITDDSNNNVVDNNIINKNGLIAGEQGGVGIFFGTNNVIRNNVLNNNFAGILINSPGNLAQGNTVGGSNTGIAISTLGAPSTVRRNTVLGNGVTDMSDGSAGCDANTWRNNTFQTDLVVGVSDGGPGVGCIR